MSEDQKPIRYQPATPRNEVETRMFRVLRHGRDTTTALRLASRLLDSAMLSIGEKPWSDSTWQSLLLGQALVALWSTLEVTIRDFLATWMTAADSSWRTKRVSDLRITVGDWLGKDKHAQAVWVVGELWRKSGDDGRLPMGRFESILDALEIPRIPTTFRPEDLPGGPDRDDTGKLITQLWALRNVIVHQAGIVDAKFCRDCPHMGLAEGQSLNITWELFEACDHAVYIYTQQVNRRISTELAQQELKVQQARLEVNE